MLIYLAIAIHLECQVLIAKHLLVQYSLKVYTFFFSLALCYLFYYSLVEHIRCRVSHLQAWRRRRLAELCSFSLQDTVWRCLLHQHNALSVCFSKETLNELLSNITPFQPTFFLFQHCCRHFI